MLFGINRTTINELFNNPLGHSFTPDLPMTVNDFGTLSKGTKSPLLRYTFDRVQRGNTWWYDDKMFFITLIFIFLDRVFFEGGKYERSRFFV